MPGWSMVKYMKKYRAWDWWRRAFFHVFSCILLFFRMVFMKQGLGLMSQWFTSPNYWGYQFSNRYLFWWCERNPQKGTSIPTPEIARVMANFHGTKITKRPSQNLDDDKARCLDHSAVDLGAGSWANGETGISRMDSRWWWSRLESIADESPNGLW